MFVFDLPGNSQPIFRCIILDIKAKRAKSDHTQQSLFFYRSNCARGVRSEGEDVNNSSQSAVKVARRGEEGDKRPMFL